MYTEILYIAEILLHLFLVFLIARKWRKNIPLKMLAIFNISIILWIVSVWIIGVFPNNADIIWLIRLTFASTSISVTSFVLFLRHIIYKKVDPTSWVFVLGSILSIVVSFMDRMVVSVHTTDSQFVPVEFGPLALFYIAFVLSGISILLVTIFKYRKTVRGLDSLRLTYLTTGIVVGGTVALITNLIFPILTGSSNSTVWGPIAVSSISIFTTYSYVENRLFGIKFIVGKTLYNAILILLAIAFLYMTIGVQRYFYQTSYSQESYIVAIISSALFTLGYLKIRDIIKDKIFPVLAFSEYNPEEVREQFTKSISTKLNINTLGIEVISTLAKMFSLSKAGVIIFRKDNSQVLYKALRGMSEERFPLRDLLQVIQYWTELGHSTVLVKDELLSKKEENSRLNRIISFMEQENLEIIMPLNRKVQLNGVILLGAKGSDSSYTIEEIQFLENLIINASMAFGRSILYQEVENFNKVLQQKVNEQTKELQVKVQELEEARRKEADMIDIMGHELRTPATIVKLNVDLLHNFIEKIPEDRESFTKYVTRIKDAVETEIKLINTLLSSAKLEGDKIEINPEKVDIYKEIDMALHGEERNAQEKNLEIVNLVSEHISPVFADRARTVEILNNLISNAVKYTEKGSVTVKAEEIENFIQISITDTGRGIPQEDISKLGTKFFRTKTYIQSEDLGDDIDIVRPGGTGLGLYVTFNLVKKMGGNISVQSEVGKGSTFTFTLPKYKDQDQLVHTHTSNNMFERLGLKKIAMTFFW